MKKVLLLVPKGAEVFEMAAFFDVLGWASVEGSVPIEVTTVGIEAEVVCTFGLKVVPDMLLDDVDAAAFDALALPGGFEEYGYYEEAYSEAVLDLIRQFRDRPVCSICVGALPVAASGILKGRKATTYHYGASIRRRQLSDMGVEVLDEQVVKDGLVTTSTSPATAVDVALDLVAQLTTQENADEVRRSMGFAPREVSGTCESH